MYQANSSTNRPYGIELYTPWLGRRRGYLSDWMMQSWVRITGRRVNLDSATWLRGPTGDTRGIGVDYFSDLAHSLKLEFWNGSTSTGLLESFDTLSGPNCDPSNADPSIVDFYEHTTRYDRLKVWSEWHSFFRPVGWIWAVLFNRRLNQLNSHYHLP